MLDKKNSCRDKNYMIRYLIMIRYLMIHERIITKKSL